MLMSMTITLVAAANLRFSIPDWSGQLRRRACVRHNLRDRAPTDVFKHRVVGRERGSHEPEVQRPAPASCPGRVINGQLIAEYLAGIGWQKGPGHHQVAGRITHAQKAEIDYSGQGSTTDQQVRGVKITMHPYRRSRPRRFCNSSLPDLHHRANVKAVSERFNRFLAHRIAVSKRPAAKVTDGPARWINSPQSADEPG